MLHRLYLTVMLHSGRTFYRYELSMSRFSDSYLEFFSRILPFNTYRHYYIHKYTNIQADSNLVFINPVTVTVIIKKDDGAKGLLESVSRDIKFQKKREMTK